MLISCFFTNSLIVDAYLCTYLLKHVLQQWSALVRVALDQVHKLLIVDGADAHLLLLVGQVRLYLVLDSVLAFGA